MQVQKYSTNIKKQQKKSLKVHLYPAEGADEAKSELGFTVRNIIVTVI